MCISEVLTRTMCCVYQRGVAKEQFAVCISEVLTRTMCCVYQRGVDKDNVLYVSAGC